MVNTIFLTFMILINSALKYSCIKTLQIGYQVITLLIFLNILRHTTTQPKMPKIRLYIKQRKLFLIMLFGIVDKFVSGIYWPKLYIKQCKSTKTFTNKLKSNLLSKYD